MDDQKKKMHLEMLSALVWTWAKFAVTCSATQRLRTIMWTERVSLPAHWFLKNRLFVKKGDAIQNG